MKLGAIRSAWRSLPLHEPLALVTAGLCAMAGLSAARLGGPAWTLAAVCLYAIGVGFLALDEPSPPTT